MTEYKPGKYRLADGREAVVLWLRFDGMMQVLDGKTPTAITPDYLRYSEYLGPAVIGAEDELTGLAAACVINSTLADRIRELEEERDDYRRKWDEAVEETRRLQQEVDDAEAEATNLKRERDNWKTASQKDRAQRDATAIDAAKEIRGLQQEIATLKDEQEKRCYQIAELMGKVDLFRQDNERLKRGDFTDEEFQSLCHNLSEEDLTKFKLGCYAYWEKLFGTQPVKHSVDADGVEWHRFDSVTVAVRDGKEASCRLYGSGVWVAIHDKTVDPRGVVREEAEAWCRKQLLPVEEWRPATVDDVAGKPECRVRAGDRWDWQYRTLLVHDTRVTSGPWITMNQDGGTGNWPICEVRK